MPPPGGIGENKTAVKRGQVIYYLAKTSAGKGLDKRRPGALVMAGEAG